ncbi:MAG: YkgJ family cysteine cluster protein [Roseburia sp.]|nr:YkgJ family cysteine cluster protein [Roseburia sp.]
MNKNLEEISDGKIYGLQDMVRAACNDCKGCHSCCEDMGDSIILEPLDVYLLQKNLEIPVQELIEKKIELRMVDGLILPNMMMDEKSNCCVFLNEEGRCSIHSFRPGICRLFPLGRIYDEKGLSYFLQNEGCIKQNRSKVKVSKWLDTPDLKRNQQYLVDWHDFRKKMEEVIEDTADEKTVKTITMFLLNTFFIQPYDVNVDFYEQFYERLARIQAVLR